MNLPNPEGRRRLIIQSCKGFSSICPNNRIEKSMQLSLVSAADELKTMYGVADEVTGIRHTHKLFQVSISMCPNACSRPQIADIGIIGAVIPRADARLCSGCNLCVKGCRENAITLADHTPAISDTCLFCGLCIATCDTGALMPLRLGFRIQLGGRLGRHPQLARELPGIYTMAEVNSIIQRVYQFYISAAKPGMRLSDVINKVGLLWLPENITR